MALKFSKLSKSGVAALVPGGRLMEHGIVAERNAAGDVRWSVAIMVDGQRIARVVGKESEGVTRSQAEATIETLRTKAREDRLDLPKGRKTAISFGEGAEGYLARLLQEGGKSVDRKAQHLRGRLVPAFKAQRINALTEHDVQRYVEQRRQNGAKPATINRELATLSHMLRKAVRWGWLSRDKLPAIDRLREGPGRIIALSQGQCEALLSAAANDHDPDLWLFVMICLQTSMRHGEARRLRWEHFDFNRQRFYIPQAKAGQRDQPLPRALATVLEGVRQERGAATGYLFSGGAGSKTGYRHTFRKAFQRAAKRAKLDASAITPHVLRHTAITKLVKAGVDLPTVQRVSGHKTLSMVLRYAHVDGIHIDDAIRHLGINSASPDKNSNASQITAELHTSD